MKNYMTPNAEVVVLRIEEDLLDNPGYGSEGAGGGDK